MAFHWSLSDSKNHQVSRTLLSILAILWSICLSSSLVHLRKGPEYLTKGTAQVFIPLIRFLPQRFVSSSFIDILFGFSLSFALV